jgi:hypothetical protein
MARMRIVAALMLILAVGTAPAQEDPVIAKLIEIGRTDNRAMEQVDILTNRLGPRLTGSDNYINAANWAVARFESYGLQNVRLEPVGEVAVGFNRGPWWGRMISPEPMELTFGTAPWTAGTKGLQRGRAILMPNDEEELAAVASIAKGAWVFQPSGGQGGGRRGRGGRRGGGANFNEARRVALEETHGIAGYVRSGTGVHIVASGRAPNSWDDLPTIPEIQLLEAHFDAIVARVRAGEEVALEFDIRNYFKMGPVPYHNVIADIPGTERPDEFVIVSGHLDSWDLATGAADDATGCATTIEAARLLMAAGAKPRRTIRFALWASEEQGLIGSRAYVNAHESELDKISAMFQHDGGTNAFRALSVTDGMMEDMKKATAPLATLNPEFPFRLRRVEGIQRGASDHNTFLNAGVPGLYWGQLGRVGYKLIHHTEKDRYDKVVPEYVEHSAMVAAMTAYGVANLDNLLARDNLRGTPRNYGFPVVNDQVYGLRVGRLSPGGAGERAGFLEGDAILSVDGEEPTRDREFDEMINGDGPIKKVRVRRGDREIELTLDFSGAAG